MIHQKLEMQLLSKRAIFDEISRHLFQIRLHGYDTYFSNLVKNSGDLQNVLDQIKQHCNKLQTHVKQFQLFIQLTNDLLNQQKSIKGDYINIFYQPLPTTTI